MAGAARPRLAHADARLRMSPEDFRVTRYKQRTQTLTIFVVDASGSTALNRLAEAKGAVELLLADCYIRRDQVAVVAFRGRKAEILLPPTRSLVRAKRGLAGLPGGGGTPLARRSRPRRPLAMLARRRGETPRWCCSPTDAPMSHVTVLPAAKRRPRPGARRGARAETGKDRGPVRRHLAAAQSAGA